MHRHLVRMIVVGVTACGDSREPPAPPPSRPPEPVAPRAEVAPESTPPRVTVRWQNVTRTDGCFFFSGPEGRDDQLVGDVKVETVEREGDQLRLRIGTAVFEGTYARGVLELSRAATYDYNGPWRTTERIRGAMQGDRLSAHYAYEECDLTTKACPGNCTVSGELVFSRGL